MNEGLKKLREKWQERADYFFEKYGKLEPIEVLTKRHHQGLPLNPIFEKHKEAIWLIDEIIDLKDRGFMTKSRAKELIAGVIEEHLKKNYFICQGFQCGKISERCKERCRLC